MFLSMFNWLESYKDQLGLLIQGFLFIATIVLIRVGWKQASAADAQAKAAQAQVVAANAQAQTATTQLNMAIKEMFATLSAADAANRPLLHLLPLPNFDSEFVGDELRCAIENQGLGPALEMEGFYGNDPADVAGLYADFMGIGEKRINIFNLERVRREGLRVRYKSTHGSIYETNLSEVFENEFVEMHTRVKNAFETLTDLSF